MRTIYLCSIIVIEDSLKVAKSFLNLVKLKCLSNDSLARVYYLLDFNLYPITYSSTIIVVLARTTTYHVKFGAVLSVL